MLYIPVINFSVMSRGDKGSEYLGLIWSEKKEPAQDLGTYPIGKQILDEKAHLCSLTRNLAARIQKVWKKMELKPKIRLKASLYEPQHNISNNVICATSKGSDQPAHTCSLIRAFAGRLNILGLLGY